MVSAFSPSTSTSPCSPAGRTWMSLPRAFIRLSHARERSSSCRAPRPHRRLAAPGVPDLHLQPLDPQPGYLPLDGFKASITAGFRIAATSFASICTSTLGGASQSQNALTSAAEASPVITARA